MTSPDLILIIRSLRTQLDVLEARLRMQDDLPRHTLADLRGLLEGQFDTTPEEIDAALYRGVPEPPE